MITGFVEVVYFAAIDFLSLFSAHNVLDSLGQIVAGFKKKENLCHGNKQRAMTMPK
jgi:hypothetical protein